MKYDKTRKLVDPSKGRDAEINRLNSVFKIFVDPNALRYVDELSKSSGTNRSVLVTELINSPPLSPKNCPKRLLSGEKRKQAGLRLDPKVILNAKAQAKADDMRPGTWVGRLIEGFASASFEQKKIPKNSEELTTGQKTKLTQTMARAANYHRQQCIKAESARSRRPIRVTKPLHR